MNPNLTNPTAPPAGLYPDPGGSGQLREWNGSQWANALTPHPTAPARKSHRGRWALGIIGMLVVAVVGCGAVVDGATATKSTTSVTSDAGAKMPAPVVAAGPTGSAADDVTIDVCKVDDDAFGSQSTGLRKVIGTVTNHSSKPSDYMIEVRFTDGGATQLGTGLAFVSSLEHGMSETWEASDYEVTSQTAISCEIVDVSRHAS